MLDLVSLGIPFTSASTGFALLRLFRLLKVPLLFDKLELDRRITVEWHNVMRLAYILCMLVYGTHLGACIFYLLGKISAIPVKDGGFGFESSWVLQNNLESASLYTKYVVSLYWSVVTATTTGYGDIVIVNELEKIIASIFMIIFNLSFAVIFGSVTGKSLSSASSSHPFLTENVSVLPFS